MNNLLKEDYNILNFENVTKNFEKFIIKGKMFTYEEDLHEEFNNFIPLDEKEQSEEEISNDIEEGDHAYFTNAENFIKTKFLEKKEINTIKIEKKKIFNVIYPKVRLELIYNKDISFLKKRIRSPNPRKRREFHDNIRKRIKRYFFNQIILTDINEELKKRGIVNYFEKFPSDFVSDVSRKRNEKLMGMTLIQIMKNKEFYKGIYSENYKHNLKILNSLKEETTENLEKILNTKYRDLFNEFLDSDKYRNFFKQLVKDKENDIYLERVLYISKSWNKFFSE